METNQRIIVALPKLLTFNKCYWVIRPVIDYHTDTFLLDLLGLKISFFCFVWIFILVWKTIQNVKLFRRVNFWHCNSDQLGGSSYQSSIHAQIPTAVVYQAFLELCRWRSYRGLFCGHICRSGISNGSATKILKNLIQWRFKLMIWRTRSV